MKTDFGNNFRLLEVLEIDDDDNYDHNQWWDWAPNYGDCSEFGLNVENAPKLLRMFGVWSLITTMLPFITSMGPSLPYGHLRRPLFAVFCTPCMQQQLATSNYL